MTNIKDIKVGDKVKVICNIKLCNRTVIKKDTLATVKEIRDGMIGIYIDQYNKDLYSLHGIVENGHGWYVVLSSIKKVVAKFKAGDRVKCISSASIDGFAKNKVGTIVEYDDSDNTYLVAFDDLLKSCHDGRGKVENGHGWYLCEKKLEKYNEFPYITISRMGESRAVKARYIKDGKVICSAKATCHKDDDFDYTIGATLALERMFDKMLFNNIRTMEDVNKPIDENKIKFAIGDDVFIVDSGKKYSTYNEWFIENDELELGTKYRYCNDDDDIEGMHGVIKALHKHYLFNRMLACVELDGYTGNILIDIDGLKKC